MASLNLTAKSYLKPLALKLAKMRAKRLLKLGRRMPVSEKTKPTLSIVMAAENIPYVLLNETINSHSKMPKGSVELIFVDMGNWAQPVVSLLAKLEDQEDIQILRCSGMSKNEAIASGINAAGGDFISYLPKWCSFDEGGLTALLSALQTTANLELVYWDGFDQQASEPLSLKPAWDPILLLERDYIGTNFSLRADYWKDASFWPQASPHAECFDLILKVTETLSDEQVGHLPVPVTKDYPSLGLTTQEMRVQQTHKQEILSLHLAKIGIDATVGSTAIPDIFKVDHLNADKVWPKVNVIIPNRDQPFMIRRLLSQLLDFTDYPNFTVTVVDNDSTDPETFAAYETYQINPLNINVVSADGPFNFSRSINIGCKSVEDGHLLLLNNDIEVISRDWLRELVTCLQFDNVGIVGAKLLFPDDTLQHAGVWIGFRNLVGHAYYKKPHNHRGYKNKLDTRHRVHCVTGAVLLVSEECARHVGSWNEPDFAVAYNDVDFCLRADNLGYKVVWTPYATLYHHESKSRSSLKSKEHQKRFEREKHALRTIYDTPNFNDSSFHPNFSKLFSHPRVSVFPKQHLIRFWSSKR